MNVIFGELLSQVDYRVVYLVVGILVVSAILAILKRAIKIAIIVFVIAFAVSGLGPAAKSFQENYKINIDNGVAILEIKGNKFELDKDNIKDIELINRGVSGYTLNVIYKDGLASTDVPTFMVAPLKAYAKQYELPFKLRE